MKIESLQMEVLSGGAPGAMVPPVLRLQQTQFLEIWALSSRPYYWTNELFRFIITKGHRVETLDAANPMSHSTVPATGRE